MLGRRAKRHKQVVFLLQNPGARAQIDGAWGAEYEPGAKIQQWQRAALVS